jgi:hypothetical protein
MTKRQRARWELEQSKQRNVTRAVVAVLALVSLLIVVGLLIDKVFIPNKTVAQIADKEISNADYQLYRQITEAQRAANNFSQGQQFNQIQPGAGDQFIAQIQADIISLRTKTAPLDYAILDQMVENQVILNSTAAEGITVSEDELQLSLAKKFAPAVEANQPAAPISPTTTLTGTASLTPTAAISPTAVPTLTVAESQSQVDIAIQTYFGTLKDFIEKSSPYGVATLPFNASQFKSFVIEQERIQLLREKLGEKLVAESEAAKEVYADADQIFISVTAAPTETAELSATLWGAGEAKINEIAKELAGGKDFLTVQAEKSDYKEDPSQPTGIRPLTDFAQFGITDVISTQPVGVIGEPFRSAAGWHIVRVTERELRPSQTDLDDKRGAAIVKWVEEKRAATPVKRFPEPTPTQLPPTLEPTLAPPAETVPTAVPAEGQPTPTP